MDGAAGQIDYRYDAFGTLIVKEVVGGKKDVSVGTFKQEVDPAGISSRYSVIVNGAESASLIRIGGVSEWTFSTSDKLGSPSTNIDAQNQVLSEFSFGPFGKSRDPNNWSVSQIGLFSGIDATGFTGHEMNDTLRLSLIDMNARQYDPVTARFLSPDDRIPNFSDSQSFNKFSYVNNNPLQWRDSTGHSPDPCSGADACISTTSTSGSSSEASAWASGVATAWNFRHEIADFFTGGEKGHTAQEKMNLHHSRTMMQAAESRTLNQVLSPRAYKFQTAAPRAAGNSMASRGPKGYSMSHFGDDLEGVGTGALLEVWGMMEGFTMMVEHPIDTGYAMSELIQTDPAAMVPGVANGRKLVHGWNTFNVKAVAQAGGALTVEAVTMPAAGLRALKAVKAARAARLAGLATKLACFVTGTMVLTTKGLIQIEKVGVGAVLTADDSDLAMNHVETDSRPPSLKKYCRSIKLTNTQQ